MIFLVSLFGFVIVFRIVSRLENLKLISFEKSLMLACLLSSPVYFFLFIKEHLIVVILYIGIISATLILFQKIINFYCKYSTENEISQLIPQLILQSQGGISAKNTFFSSLKTFPNWQQQAIRRIVRSSKAETEAKSNESNSIFFDSVLVVELVEILNSNSFVIEQLSELRDSIKLIGRMRHKSRIAAQQCRIQALVAGILYVFLFSISVFYLGLNPASSISICSGFIFMVGQIIVFSMGRKIKWKT